MRGNRGPLVSRTGKGQKISMPGAGASKLEALILYLAYRMERDSHVGRGRIKLAKLLFRIDFEAFARWGKPVTEATYHADELGPVPTQELTAIRDLEAEGRFEWRPGWDRQKLPAVLGPPPTLDAFDAREAELVTETLDQFQLKSADAMVDQAHDFPGWRIAWRDGLGDREPIPFESIFWNPSRPPGSKAEAWENEYAAVLANRYADLLSE